MGLHAARQNQLAKKLAFLTNSRIPLMPKIIRLITHLPFDITTQ